MIALVFSALTAVVFVLDARAPLGANVPLLYIVPTLVTIWHAGSRGLAAPAICTALIVVRMLWFPSGDWSLGLFNRTLTTVVLWSTAILLLRFKLADARVRAQAEAARFGEMAMVIAHELRNALAGIRTAVDVFGARPSISARDQDVRSEMIRRVQSLEHFVADLLTLSRPVRAQLAQRRLMPVVRRAVESLKRDPRFDGVTVDIADITDAAASIDDTLVESALVHLLRNAAEAMDGAGPVAIGLTHDGRVSRITIRDAGPGIPSGIRQKVFDPFFTTSSSRRGLGLPIARRAIEHHGGSLAIESEDGRGTTAIVTLPSGTAITD